MQRSLVVHTDQPTNLLTILCVTLFAMNNNKSNKSHIEYEIKRDLFNISPENKTKKA